MKIVEVKILKYTFQFRQLSWREETSVQNGSRLRGILSKALVEVSGLKVKSPEDALKVLRPLPDTVLQRVFILYKGNLPMPRRFSTVGVYKAPEPGKLVKRMEEVEQQRDRIMDRVEQELEAKFGKQELHEQLELERQMAKNSKLRGATKATPDEESTATARQRRDVEGKTGTMPPIKQGTIFRGRKNGD